MAKREKIPTLHATAGDRVGKKYKLKKSQYTIGSDKRCTITVGGEFVSELHATIEKSVDSGWVIRNNSPNGTYVNENKIDTALLTDRSIIQIGSNNRFEFVSTPVTVDNPVKSEKKKPANKNKKWIYIGLAVVAIYVPGFIYVLNLAKDAGTAQVQESFTLTEVTDVLASSTEYLNSNTVNFENSTVEQNNSMEYSNNYYRLADSSLNEAKREELIAEILAQTKGYLFNAHRFNQMDSSTRAIAELTKAMRVVPDPRFPANQFAVSKISSIRRLMPPRYDY